jgi:FkbM family methyltransferase
MLKKFAESLPAGLREPLLAKWRLFLGNPEINILKYLADRSKLSLDIGANGGSYTGELARLSSGCVAFEPIPELANLVAEQHKTTRVHACALSDRQGTVTLRIPIFNGGENPQNASVEPDDLTILSAVTRDIEVPRFRLDDFDLGPVGLIKMDVEGHEESVLFGAANIIRRDKPTVLIEADEPRHKAGCVASISKYFFDYGYEGFFLLGRRVQPFAKFDLAQHQNPAHLDADKNVIFNREYANLFIFASDPKVIEVLASMASRGVPL